MLKILFRWGGQVDGWLGGWVAWLEKWGLKLTSAKVEVEVEAELGRIFSLKFFHLKFLGSKIFRTYGVQNYGYKILICVLSSVIKCVLSSVPRCVVQCVLVSGVQRV